MRKVLTPLCLLLACSSDPTETPDSGPAIDAAVDGGIVTTLVPLQSPVCMQSPVGVDGTQTVTVRHTGPMPVALTARLEGTERILFSASDPSPATVADGEVASVEVGFRPASQGWHSVLVRVLASTTTASAAIRVYALGLPSGGGAFDGGPLPSGAVCP
jgi:hypothetical protein